jgi:hypothetical protein
MVDAVNDHEVMRLGEPIAALQTVVVGAFAGVSPTTMK